VPDPISALLNRPDGQSQSLTLRTAIPNPDLQLGSATAVIDWPALPFEPTGIYSVTVMAGGGISVSLPFLVEVPTEEKILVVPQAGTPGTLFQVYYVNFDMNSTATIDLYGEDNPVIGGYHEMSQRSIWTVMIDRPLAGSPGKGWAQATLASQATDVPAAYSVTYDNKRVFDLFWLR
jgi:hypothetical protein